MDEVIRVVETYAIDQGDFVKAGEASSSIKRILRQLGLDSSLIRNVSIAAYETEMNMIIHSEGGTMSVEITPNMVIILAEDNGPGIPDVQLAMTEGYSTAPDEVCQMGFGAGMGLPNIKRNCSRLNMQSEVGKGTRLCMEFDV